MRYNMLHTDDGNSVIVIVTDDGQTHMLTEDDPRYLRVAEAILRKEDPTPHLTGTYESAAPVITNLSARVSDVDGVIHFDGEPIHNALADTIARYRTEERDPSNLIKFMERLSTNPSANSREQLFTWTQARDLTINADGFIVGYKGVTARTRRDDHVGEDGQSLFPLDRYPFMSSSSGHGIVDGIEVTGHLPMGVGVTVEMPRTEVEDNPRQGCSTGLHVGTFDYAKGYARAGALLEVLFDPADVVSVPSECGYAKLRCCRYSGVALHELERGDDLSDHEPTSAWDQDEAWEVFAQAEVPQTFWQATKAKFRRNKAKAEVED